MRRLNDDSGAVAVLVGVVMVALLGFAALGLDSAILYAEKRIVQNGADAAALAVAQSCAGGTCDASLADEMAARNDGRSPTRAAVDDVVFPTESKVRVRVASDVANNFAPVLGGEHEVTTVTGEATAAWGAPTGGTAMLPFAVSWCEFAGQTGDGTPSETEERTIAYRDPSDWGVAEECNGPSGLAIPGGFGWLATDDGTCAATSHIEEQTPVKPGNSVPLECTVDDFRELHDETLMLPVYKERGGQGNNGWITVHGYAAFTLTGYRLSGSKYNWNSPCSGSTRCLQGYFTEFVAVGDFPVGEAPDLGTNTVRLVN